MLVSCHDMPIPIVLFYYIVQDLFEFGARDPNFSTDFFTVEPGVKKNFQKTLLLVFEVIMQPPKTHFFTFSKVQKHNMERKKVRPKS